MKYNLLRCFYNCFIFDYRNIFLCVFFEYFVKYGCYNVFYKSRLLIFDIWIKVNGLSVIMYVCL